MARISKVILDLHNNVKRHIDNGKDPKKFLNYTQFQIVKYLFDHKDEEVCQKDLEVETKLKKASMTGALNSLENKNIIKRVQSKADKRKNYIVLTEKVENIRKDFEKRIEIIDAKMAKNISKEEMNTFFKVIEKINKNLEKEDK